MNISEKNSGFHRFSQVFNVVLSGCCLCLCVVLHGFPAFLGVFD